MFPRVTFVVGVAGPGEVAYTRGIADETCGAVPMIAAEGFPDTSTGVTPRSWTIRIDLALGHIDTLVDVTHIVRTTVRI